MKQGYGKGMTGMSGLALGAGLMYLYDPERGRRRRHLVRDKFMRGARRMGTAAGRTASDVRHRTRGLGARARHLVQRRPPDDRVLEERVRAQLGRLSAHPHAIDVFAQQGTIELTGPILASELPQVVEGVRRVRGVAEVITEQLDPHEHPGNTPSLQGGQPAWPARRSWSPAARLLAGAGGAALLGVGRRLPGLLGVGVGAVGLGLVARSLVNRQLGQLISPGAEREGIQLEKIFEVAAPSSEVFALWSKFEEFPRFLSHVKSVRRTEDGHTHWEVTGPAGTTAAWTAELTKLIPNRVIAWRSLPGAPIETAGEVRFRNSRLGTRVEVLMSYRPPAGAVGHAVASLFGANPKKQIDEDMLRFKSLLEAGRATGRSETVRREEVLPPLGHETRSRSDR